MTGKSSRGTATEAAHRGTSAAGALDRLVADAARSRGDAEALASDAASLSYAELDRRIDRFAAALPGLGLREGDRVAIFMGKRIETVVASFGTFRARGVVVPINPLLKPRQLEHVLRDSGARILVTTGARIEVLLRELGDSAPAAELVAVEPETCGLPLPDHWKVSPWHGLDASGPVGASADAQDIAAILYTSGSTGRPKGVVLTHANLWYGAESVVEYLGQGPEDRVLAALPLSFDAGFSQLTTAFRAGGTAVLHDYLLAADVIRAIERHRITGLTGVPPLWIRLAALDWPQSAAESLRFIANTGGAMPTATLDALRRRLPDTRVFLMYGFTEAFRSTYLPPEQIDVRPTSIGRAIPNAYVFLARADGSLGGPGETGELVHAGPLVSRGYWNDPETTARRFHPIDAGSDDPLLAAPAAWSGDTVRMDDEGYLYFVARNDEMIKTSGYRVSPTEIEEVVYATGAVGEAVALGVPDAELGQVIVLVVTPATGATAVDEDALIRTLRRELPAYMVPARVAQRASLARNPNGKFDRLGLARELAASA